MHNGEMTLHDKQIEPLEHNSELGVYLKQPSLDNDCVRDVYFAQFNPKHRLLASAGQGFIAHLWDLRNDEFYKSFRRIEMPHIRSEGDNQNTDVSSVHWNTAGDKLLTSSSDMVARVWRVCSDATLEIWRAKNFHEYLMQSKFCDDDDNLVATGGLMSQIYVWNCATPDCREVACFDHSLIDHNFKGLEIEWQNAKQVAVAGKSKFIYLWSVDRPNEPLIKWEGHQDVVEQIQWDPNKRLLASCSTSENLVYIWSPEKTGPELQLNKPGESAVATIRWSNDCGGDESMLAAGCSDG